MFGRRFVVALAVTLGLGAAACQPLAVGSGGSGSPCYVGSFNLSSLKLPSSIPSEFGPIGITKTGGSEQLVTTATTWQLTASGLTFVVSYNGANVGTAVVDAAASGTLSASGSTLTFGLTSLSGSAHFVGTVPGIGAVDTTIPLDRLGVSELVGLSGSATFGCGASGLTLTFGGGQGSDFEMDF